MDSEYTKTYATLNKAQRTAVDTIEGALLVIAGPGTGKTQLLSTRAAHIVAKSDAAPQNILCLTYTETGASEMRSRLGRIMGPAGGEVAVHTFHSFGSWLIAQYPEQFSDERTLQPLDELARFSILESLLQQLPFRHQLAVRDENERFIRQHSVEEAIRAFKQAGLTPAMVKSQLDQNSQAYGQLQPLLDELFASNLTAKRLGSIEALVASYLQQAEPHTYSAILLEGLATAVSDSLTLGKTAPLGAWRSSHTVLKNKQRILKAAANDKLLHETVKLYERYQAELAKAGRYDYEDMILWAIAALETNDDIRLDVAERFQYIMVDEYQDTNGAQNRLLNCVLQANPLDSPNAMVVGDDDQAIMRFQGAETSGMLQFVETYHPTVIVLQENYRSSQLILDASRQIITQTEERLEVSLPALQLNKSLIARSDWPQTSIEHVAYVSPSAAYNAVGEQVEQLLADGVTPSDIGIIGRKHSELTTFVTYLQSRNITITYDRRENILEHDAIVQLLALARYIYTLASQPKRAQSLLPTVLAADYWQLAVLDRYKLAAEAKANEASWLDTMLQGDDPRLAQIAEWLIAAADASLNLNFTQMLDVLLGRAPLSNTKLQYSPFRVTYQNQPPDRYITLLSHLISLRAAVLDNRPQAHGLQDMLAVCDQYRLSGLRLIDDNPVLRGDNQGVQVMSAHGAKGREFKHVIILSTIDEVWGNRARSQNTRIFLPENMPLYPAGDAESDKLRLLYVAMTRAKSQLHLVSYSQSDAGKSTTPLSFLSLGDTPGWWQPRPATLEPEHSLETLEAAWAPRAASDATLRQALQPALRSFRLSPTALRDFIDIRYAGPTEAVERHVLRFPSAYNAHSALGNATHKALQVAHAAFARGTPLSTEQLLVRFDEALTASGLSESELQPVRSHAHQFLPTFVAQYAKSDFAHITTTEQFLHADSPTHHVPLSGAIDALAEDDNNYLRIIDYKTGRPPLPHWETKGLSDSKKVSLHFYRQQLLFYKLLADNSSLYKGKQQINCTELVFVENSDEAPDEFIRLSITDFDAAELQRTEQLMKAVYDRYMQADLPDITGYSHDLKGVQAFEDDLLAAQ